MSQLAYGRGTYRRLAAGLPELRLVNVFVEAAATSQDNVVLLGRPGLVLKESRSGPIRGIFYQAGTLGDQVFTVGGNVLSGDSDLGSIGGAGAVRFAASATELLVTAGNAIYRTDGSGLSTVAFPDDADVASLAFIGGLFVAVRRGTQRFYWSGVLDGLTWDALDYASAESSPDPLLDAIVVGDVLWLMGSETIEPWSLTGAADLPFSRIEGRNYQRGLLATGCACALDNTIFWIGDDRRVYRGDAVPKGLSDAGIEERIAASVTASVFTFSHEGHKFFCVRLDTETLAYDVATQEWCEFASYGVPNWRVGCATAYRGRSILGDAISGDLWTLDSMAFADGAAPLPRLFTAFQPIQDGGLSVDVLHLDAEFGATPLLTGQGSQPLVEMRSSRDSGRTWTGWRDASLGKQGEFRHRAAWRRLGTFDAPGMLAEIRVTDPVRLRVSAVRANEFQGGRSR